MAIRAINTLEETMRAAYDAPIPLPVSAALALDWLQHDGIAIDHQAGRFQEAVETNRLAPGAHGDDNYMRHTTMEMMIYVWQEEVRRRDREGYRDGDPIPTDPFAKSKG